MKSGALVAGSLAALIALLLSRPSPTPAAAKASRPCGCGCNGKRC
jgi:hypothetical protein